MRQFLVFLDQTNAPPSPNPFCGGILPAAMCNGWSVNSVYAHPGTDLKLKAAQASEKRSPSRRNPPAADSLEPMPVWKHPTALTSHSTAYMPPGGSPLFFPSTLGAAFRLSLGTALSLRPFVRRGRDLDNGPTRMSGSPLCSVCMGLVNCLRHFANVLSRFALGLDGMGIDLGAVAERQSPLRMLQM